MSNLFMTLLHGMYLLGLNVDIFAIFALIVGKDLHNEYKQVLKLTLAKRQMRVNNSAGEYMKQRQSPVGRYFYEF